MKTTLIIVLGRIVQVLISFLSLKIITNFLSKENVAYYFLFLSVMNYFGLALISPVGQYFNRKIHQWTERNVLLERLLLHTIYVLIVSMVSLPLMWVAIRYFGIMNGLDEIKVCFAIGLTVFFNTMITTIVPTFNMLNHRVAFVIFTNIWLLLSLVLSIYFINTFGESVLSWFYGQVLAQAIVILFAAYFLIKYTKSKLNIKYIMYALNIRSIKSVFDFCFPLMISTLLMWIATDSFRFVLEKKFSLEYVGLFSVGFAISQRLSYAVESIVQQILYPSFYEKINSKKAVERKEAWLELAYISVPLYGLLTIFTVITAPILIRIFSGPNYIEAYYFVIMGAIFHFLRKVTALFSLGAHSEMQTKILIGPYFIGALFSSFGVYFFSEADFHRPAIIVVIGALAALMLMIFNTRKVLTLVYRQDLLISSFKKVLRK